MHDDVVDRRTERRRVAPIVQKGGHAAGAPNGLLGETVELGGGDARLDQLRDAIQDPMDDAIRLVHELDLARGLQNHHASTFRSSASSSAAATSSMERSPSIGISRSLAS